MLMVPDKSCFLCQWASVPDHHTIIPPSLDMLPGSCTLNVIVSAHAHPSGMPLANEFAHPDAVLEDAYVQWDDYNDDEDEQNCDREACLNKIAFWRGKITFRPGFDVHTRHSLEWKMMSTMSMMAGESKQPTAESLARELSKLTKLKQGKHPFSLNV